MKKKPNPLNQIAYQLRKAKFQLEIAEQSVWYYEDQVEYLKQEYAKTRTKIRSKNKK